MENHGISPIYGQLMGNYDGQPIWDIPLSDRPVYIDIDIDREREKKKIHIYIVIEYDIWKNMESFIMESLLNAIDMFSICEFP